MDEASGSRMRHVAAPNAMDFDDGCATLYCRILWLGGYKNKLRRQVTQGCLFGMT